MSLVPAGESPVALTLRIMTQPRKWSLSGPPETSDEAIHVLVLCRSCGHVFGEYLLAGRVGLLSPVGHESNELPQEPGWVRVGARTAKRGRLSGAVAYKLETFKGKTYVRWICRGRHNVRCSSRPKIEWTRLVGRAMRLAQEAPERPIEIRL